MVSFHTQCCISNVTKFIQYYVKTAYIKSFTNQEIHYILPFDEVKKGNFQSLFSALDGRMSDLDISSYGVMDTNLEEVFLKVTEQSNLQKSEEGKDFNFLTIVEDTGPITNIYLHVVPWKHTSKFFLKFLRQYFKIHFKKKRFLITDSI